MEGGTFAARRPPWSALKRLACGATATFRRERPEAAAAPLSSLAHRRSAALTSRYACRGTALAPAAGRRFLEDAKSVLRSVRLSLVPAEQDMQLKKQIEELQANVTDRGLVVTLGDALFATGSADLRAEAAASDLCNLIAFLEEHPGRTAVIEGHTDSLGAQGFNHGLSQRRADAVMAYLVARGVHPRRVSALGKGESEPVAANNSAAGRQSNRRVEVIIANPPAALR